jgi:malate dehydrogenase (oxaloacetate-decarboxylating)|tara:strand:+ start:2730 stop:4184 length:1455 start_codon:yes stop_codon:yes gene_type:complete
MSASKNIKPGVANSITIRAKYPNTTGMLAKIINTISNNGGDMSAIDVVSIEGDYIVRDLTINTNGNDHAEKIIDKLNTLKEVNIQNVSDQTFLLHLGGKIEVNSAFDISTRDDMSKAYTPGVGRISSHIHKTPEAAWALTTKSHTIAVVTDGSAVLGLGNIGPEAALPVMEGKAMILKNFANVDAWPICLNTQDEDEIVDIVKAISPGFGGINLEDISAPRCFYIEQRLKQEIDIPVFHDDQHGTAIVVLAALINSLKIVNKKPKDIKIVIAGVGAAGIACANILMDYGVKNIIGIDRQGIVSRNRNYNDNIYKKNFAEKTNPENIKGDLKKALKNADCFIGLAGPNMVTKEMLEQMKPQSIVFALANPVPEIMPELIPSNVKVMATGRSDYPNQVNNSLAFPGIFKGILEVRAKSITDKMKISAAKAIASVIPRRLLSSDFIIPSVFDKNVVKSVSENIAAAAVKEGVSRKKKTGINYYSFKN